MLRYLKEGFFRMFWATFLPEAQFVTGGFTIETFTDFEGDFNNTSGVFLRRIENV